jgi:PTS system ascorbate-specific IIA component
VLASDDPFDLLPNARDVVRKLDTGDGVLIFTDIYGATPGNLAGKLQVPAGSSSLPASTCQCSCAHSPIRAKGMDTMITKAVSGGRDGVLHIAIDPVYATTRG